MAGDDEIYALRLLVAEFGEDSYTQEELSDRIDTAGGDLNAVAYQIWTEKAARYSALVDISEGGSSRKNSSLQAQALIMVAHFKGLLPVEDSGGSTGLRIKRLTR